MRVALPIWMDRISPVFDVAGRLLVAELDGQSVQDQAERPLDVAEPGARAKRLSEMGVDVLICGAISRQLEARLTAAGVSVIGQTCGAVGEVLDAYLNGRLEEPRFAMPGCCGNRHRARGGNGGRGRRKGRTQ